MPQGNGKKSKSSSPPAIDGPPLASLALSLSKQEWSKLTMSDDNPHTMPTPDLEILVERVTALLLVRLVAIISPPGTFPDYSTTMICSTVIQKQKLSWPKQITTNVMKQLRDYVMRILSGYKEVPYHNREHAYHVILSINKLLDMMVCCYTNMDDGNRSGAAAKKFKPPPSFGLRNDPMAMFALVFAALIHDVEHQGLPNRQLASENDRLAVLYNDQSIAENWSLYVAFSEFLQDEFIDLRKVLFGENIESDEHSERYHVFRRMVVNTVLATDLASPERTQVGKSKWKEAFGQTQETVEAKLKNQWRRMSTYSNLSNVSGESGGDASSSQVVATLPDASMGGSFGGDGSSHTEEYTTAMHRRRSTNDSGLSSEFTTTAEEKAQSPATNGPIESVHETEYEDSVSGTPDPSTSGDLDINTATAGRGPLSSGVGGEIFDSSSAFSLHTAPPAVSSSENSKTKLKTERGAPLSPQRSPSPNNTLRASQVQGLFQSNQALLNQNSSVAVADLPDYEQSSFLASSRSLSVSDHLPSDRDGARFGNSDVGVGAKSLNQFLSKTVHSSKNFASRYNRSGGKTRYRQRLGILRTVDLGGETLETYSRHDRHSSSQSTVAFTVADQEADEPNELKMTVVMETIMAAADVAHNLQSWEHMIVWSRRLYFELRRAHAAGRGVDVSPNWFENQIGFLESYVLPLARRLEDTGVWGDENTLPGFMFARNVEHIRDEWISEGFKFTKELIELGNQIFPPN